MAVSPHATLQHDAILSAELEENTSTNLSNMNQTYYYYEYDYDYEDTGFTDDELLDLIPVAVFYGLVFLLGTVGNILVIYCVAKYKRMKSITNQLLLSLACADLLLTVFCVPIKVRTKKRGWDEVPTLSNFLERQGFCILLALYSLRIGNKVVLVVSYGVFTTCKLLHWEIVVCQKLFFIT